MKKMYIHYIILSALYFNICATDPEQPTTMKAVPIEFVNQLKSESEFETKVLKNSKPVVVKFFAHWCGPCRRMKAIFNSVALELHQKVDFIEIDIDQYQNLANKHGVRSIPTFMYFINGESKGTISKSLDANSLKAKIREYFKIK